MILALKKLILFVVMFLPCSIVVLLKPLIKIRFGYLRSYIIGHLCQDSSIYFNENKSKYDFFYLRGDICNSFLINKIKKILKINSIVKYFYLFFYYFNFNKSTHLIYHNRGSRDYNNVIKKSNIFTYSDIENSKGMNFLKKIFKYPDKKIICLLIRDQEYKKKFYNSNNFEYHSYRNSDANSYLPLIKNLIDKDYNVIRMGNIAKFKINLDHECFYDYPFSEIKEDFFDIWLMSNCSFVISTGSGLDEVSKIFQIPRLYINKVPISDIISTGTCMTAPKKLFNTKNNCFLHLTDYLKYSFFETSDYYVNNIKLVDLSPEEMISITDEFIFKLLNNTLSLQSENQKLFWRIVKNHKQSDIFHKVYDNCANLSDYFLENNKEFLINNS